MLVICWIFAKHLHILHCYNSSMREALKQRRFLFCLKGYDVTMLKSCIYCGRVHDERYVCDKKPKRIYSRYSQETVARKTRRTHRWTEMSKRIRTRDKGIDQAAIHGLDGKPYIQTRELEVHHIIPIEEDSERAYDPYNLITLSKQTHEKAERGEISREALLAIAKANTDGTKID